MANIKKIIVHAPTGASVYCIVERDVDGYLLDNADGSFADGPADPYLDLAEDGTIKGRYTVSELRAAWDAGKYNITAYRSLAGAGSENPVNDTVEGSGIMIIEADTEVIQTGDSFARLGAPAGASVIADIATNLEAILTRLASTPYASEHPPVSVTVTDGTILSGDNSCIQTINQIYLKVQETGQFKIDTEYSGVDEEHTKFYIVYRYFGIGSVNHKVEAKMWNYTTSAWDDALATNNDLPATNEDRTIIFDVPGTISDYYDGLIPNLTAKLRIDHVSNFNADHQFWLDTVGLGRLETIYSAPDNVGIAAIKQVAGRDLLQCTTIATLASQISFTLTEGSTDDNAYNNALAVITDATTLEQKAVGRVSDYVGSTMAVTLSADPSIYTIDVGDIICLIANTSTAALVNAIISEKVDTLLDINKSQDLTINTTTRLEYQWLDSAGDPVDISALTFKFKAVKNARETSPAIPEITGAIQDGPNGRWYFDVLPTTVFKGRYEIWAIDGASKITPLTMAGGVRIEAHPRL